MILIDLVHLSSSHHLIRFDSPYVCVSFASRTQSIHHSHSDANVVEIDSLPTFDGNMRLRQVHVDPLAPLYDEVTRLVALSEHIVFLQRYSECMTWHCTCQTQL